MTPTPGTGSGWKVESQQPSTEMGPGGTFVRGYTINFVTAMGLRGSVFVPLTQYNAANGAEVVRQLVASHVMQMESVQNLTG